MVEHGIRLSKKMTHILRHHAPDHNLSVTDDGYVELQELTAVINNHYFPTTMQQILDIVQNDDRNRFKIAGTLIRANQGHTFPVNLGYQPATPPTFLYHGTTTFAVTSILKQGILPKGRHAVHLTENIAVAEEVALRSGEPVILQIRTENILFTLSENNVWLADTIPPENITIMAPKT